MGSCSLKSLFGLPFVCIYMLSCWSDCFPCIFVFWTQKGLFGLISDRVLSPGVQPCHVQFKHAFWNFFFARQCACVASLSHSIFKQFLCCTHTLNPPFCVLTFTSFLGFTQGYLSKWNTTVVDILRFTALSRLLNLCSPSQCSYLIAMFWPGLHHCWEARRELLPLAWISRAAAPWSHFGSGITPQHNCCPSWGEQTRISQNHCVFCLHGFSHLLRYNTGHAHTPWSMATQKERPCRATQLMLEDSNTHGTPTWKAKGFTSEQSSLVLRPLHHCFGVWRT